MPTAIREVDLSTPITPLEHLESYRVMIVFRWRRRIVGRTFAPVAGDRIDRPDLNHLIDATCGRDALQQWLDESLGYDERSLVGAERPTATVAICTRDRPHELCRTLSGVMALAHRGHEVLVVDNAPSTESTRQLVEQTPGARYIREPRRGLNAARNRALREATGEVVAFTDDDAVPETEWLDALLANFADRRVVCVTGLTLPIELDTDAQELFEEHCPFARGFRRRIFDGQHENPLFVGPVGAGANMAIRRDALDQIGLFDERLDGGMPTRSGGDHEMFARILTAGYRIVYDPAAVSWHRHRRTREELLDAVYGYGVGVYAMWTGLLLERRELGVLRLAWLWFREGQLPTLLGSWRRGSSLRRALVRAELHGCLHGPRAWLAARRLRLAEP
jgi:GT2 family glycosyltransferase